MEDRSGNSAEMDLFVFLGDVLVLAKRKWRAGLMLILLCGLILTGYQKIRFRPV